MKNFVQLTTKANLEFNAVLVSQEIGCDLSCFVRAGGNELIEADALLPRMKSLGYRLLNVSSVCDGELYHFFNFVLEQQ